MEIEVCGSLWAGFLFICTARCKFLCPPAGRLEINQGEFCCGMLKLWIDWSIRYTGEFWFGGFFYHSMINEMVIFFKIFSFLLLITSFFQVCGWDFKSHDKEFPCSKVELCFVAFSGKLVFFIAHVLRIITILIIYNV